MFQAFHNFPSLLLAHPDLFEICFCCFQKMHIFTNKSIRKLVTYSIIFSLLFSCELNVKRDQEITMFCFYAVWQCPNFLGIGVEGVNLQGKKRLLFLGQQPTLISYSRQDKKWRGREIRAVSILILSNIMGDVHGLCVKYFFLNCRNLVPPSLAVQKHRETFKYCRTKEKRGKHTNLIWKSRGLVLLNTAFCLIPLQIISGTLIDS